VSQARDAVLKDQSTVQSGLVALFDAWHAAEPNAGHDAKATEWRAKRVDGQTTTQAAAP
jgi:hypothetical protein